VQVESGGTSGMVNDDSEIFRLDTLETLVARETSTFAFIPLNSYTTFQTAIMKHSVC
jgi:hypothetical protein